MLSPDYLSALPEAALELWRQVEEDILQDMARRIAKTGRLTDTAQWQKWRLEQIRLFRRDMVKQLARMLNKSESVVRQLLTEACTETLRSEDEIHRAAGKDPPPPNDSHTLKKLLNAGAKQTNGTFYNLTATTANTATRQFERALDRAWLQVSSGAFDYKTAVKRCVDDLADRGLEAIAYPSGHVDTLEVAVRRAVLTGVNQTAGKLQGARMEEMGCEFCETTAHAGARPEHAVWQGKVFHIGGAVTVDGVHYPDFVTATGYGTGPGIYGWNCSHQHHAFYPGLSEWAYSDAKLAQMNARDIEYQGRKYTLYEIRQMQRKKEVRVRKYKRRFLCEEAAGVDSSLSALKLRESRADLRQFAYDTGGRVDSARTMVQGFGRSEAGKATWTARNGLANPENGVTIKAITGARITNPDSKAATAHAERYYGLVRSMTTDTARIAQNTGFSEGEIYRIKCFIFLDEHDLGNGKPERFAADFAIAQSWQRLISGKPEVHDMTLLRHEQMEKQLMDSGMTQEEAHLVTSEKYNYSKEVRDYYASLKEHRNQRNDGGS